MDVFIDCETTSTNAQWYIDEIEVKAPGQYKKPDSIEKWLAENADAERQRILDRTAVDTSLAKIICLCYAIDDSDITELTGTESEILNNFFRSLGLYVGQRKSLLIGHNILSFDIPLIYHRAIINGLRPHPAFNMHYKPWDGLTFDTMTEWAGARGTISQHNLARLLGIETQDVDGSEIPKLYAEGKIDEIAAKCAFDVTQNREIYRRITDRG